MQVSASKEKEGQYLEEERKEQRKGQRKEQEEKHEEEQGESRELPCQQEPMLEEEQRREQSPFTCNICHKICTSKTRLVDHLRSSHKNPGSCNICGKSFPSDKKLKEHIKAVHTGANHPCQKCLVAFKTRSTLVQHELRCCGTSPPVTRRKKQPTVPCFSCGKTFSSPTSLRRHMWKVHNLVVRGTRHRQARRKRSLWFCTVCRVTFTRKNAFTRHSVKKHKNTAQEREVEMLRCHLCDIEVVTVSELEGHRRESHGEEKAWPCSQCAKTFASKKNLGDHRRRVHCARKFKCEGGDGKEGCGRTFKRKDDMKKHMKCCGRPQKSFEELSRWGKAHRAKKKAEDFISQLRALDGEERVLVLRKMAQEDPTLLDLSPSNPLSMDDIIGVSLLPFDFLSSSFLFQPSIDMLLWLIFFALLVMH